MDEDGTAEDGVHDGVERASDEGCDGEGDERACNESGRVLGIWYRQLPGCKSVPLKCPVVASVDGR
jgi:hypothetical protein